jgi:hypothetical protein
MTGWLIAATAIAEPAPIGQEAQIKAHFVLTAVRFVTWPAPAFRGERDPIVFGVLGDAEVADSMDAMLAGRTIGGRPVRLERLRSASGAAGCHVLFVGRAEAGRAGSHLERVRRRWVLTVIDSDRLAPREGILALRLHEGLIQFEVNLDESRRAGLEISSKLLRLGSVVRDRNLEASR